MSRFFVLMKSVVVAGIVFLFLGGIYTEAALLRIGVLFTVIGASPLLLYHTNKRFNEWIFLKSVVLAGIILTVLCLIHYETVFLKVGLFLIIIGINIIFFLAIYHWKEL